MEGGNAKQIKQLNKDVLRKLLKGKSYRTKPELAELSGLSVVTVNSLIKELIEDNEVRELNEAKSTGGRRAKQFKYNENFKHFLVVCLSNEEERECIHLGVANALGDIIFEEKHRFPTLSVENMLALMTIILIKFPIISFIAVGIPGLEIEKQLRIMDFKLFRNVNLREIISERFSLPVFIENDVNAAVYGYCKGKGIFNHQCVVGVYYPSTKPFVLPGAGIYLKGEIYSGKNGIAGEIGHLPLKTAIQEYQFIGAKELERNLFETVLSLESVLDPDTFLIYGNDFSDDNIERLKTFVLRFFPSITLPEVILRNDFSKDFTEGIRKRGLVYLNEHYK
ncbi:hypothetical protein SDC9_70379 [bioreactor metagenome]|uniref:Uncharacterized protein n=1 Tax=bioreactor metagenome TaxID=1076179 RepID=A0A644Y5R8_9ZZZZ